LIKLFGASTAEKRRTLITLSQSNQPSGCSFLRQRASRLASRCPNVSVAEVDFVFSCVLDLFSRRVMF
jgi:hypothetical protein